MIDAGLRQLPIPFAFRPALGADDFLVAPGNADAVAWLDRWPDWPGGGLAIHGPRACGKSHLAQVWRARSDAPVLGPADVASRSAALVAAALDGEPRAVVVEDVDRGVDERALLHLYNALAGGGGHLLVTGVDAPARWDIGLPDLRSRLLALPAVAVAPPDDALLAAVLVKQFADRQLRVAPPVIDFLIARMERSFAAARDMVAAIDEASLSRRREITVPLAREVLAQVQIDDTG